MTDISRFPVFCAPVYLLHHKDLVNAFGKFNYRAALDHWKVYGINEGRMSSPAFHVRHYLNNHSDLVGAFGANNYHAAVGHWFVYGINEGRESSPYFNVKFYLSKHKDLIDAFGANNFRAALNHWLTYGIREGRQGISTFNIRDWVNKYPEVKKLVNDESNKEMGFLLAWYFFYYFGDNDPNLGDVDKLNESCLIFPNSINSDVLPTFVEKNAGWFRNLKWYYLNKGEKISLGSAVAALFITAQISVSLKVITRSGNNLGHVYSNVYGPAISSQGGHVNPEDFVNEHNYSSPTVALAGYVEVKFTAREDDTFVFVGVSTEFQGIPVNMLGPSNAWNSFSTYLGRFQQGAGLTDLQKKIWDSIKSGGV